MASTYLTKTLGTPTNNKKFTFSCWVKKSAVEANMDIFHAGSSGSDEAIMCRFESAGHITIKHDVGNSQEMLKQTNAKYRDPNAWYHIVTVFDTDNSTAEDRQRIYVNGERITDWLSGSDDNFSQGDDVLGNKAVSHTIGKRNFDSNHYLDACLSHVHFCDGQAYDASYFGETDSTTGEWKIKTSPSVTYGNNGFFIFKDGTNLSGSTVQDQSGNSNNWTVSGGTLTKTEDNPSNVFATMNILNKENGGSTLSLGNTKLVTTAQGGGPYTGRTIATLGATSGKYYWEVKVLTDPSSTYPVVAIVGEDFSVSDSSAYLTGNNANSKTYITYKLENGNVEYNFTGSRQGGSYGSSASTNDIIGVALDLDNGKVFFSKNGTWGNSGDPANGTNPASSSVGSLTGNFVFPAFGDENYSSSATLAVNFGNGYFGTTAVSSAGTNASGIGIFEYDVPTGFTALSTKGLNE